MVKGQEANGQRAQSVTRRRRIGRLALPILVGVTVLALVLWVRWRGPRGKRVASLESVVDRSTMWIGIWPANDPRSVRLLVWQHEATPLIGTAGPAGVAAESAGWARDLRGPYALRGWHGDAVAYRDRASGALYLVSASCAEPRKLTETVPPSNGWWPAWSPDGRRLAVAVGNAKKQLNGVRIFSSGGEPIAEAPVPEPGERWGDMLWSASGRRLLVWYLHGSTPSDAKPKRQGADAVVLSEPDWRPVPVRFPGLPLYPLAWADDETVAGVTWGELDSAIPIRFIHVLSGKQVGCLDCEVTSVGAPALATGGPSPLKPAPSGAGVIARFVRPDEPAFTVHKATWRFRDSLDRRPLGWRLTTWAYQHAYSRVAYVYIPISGTRWRTIAVSDRARGDFTVSVDGRELLYVDEDWNLRAAPLPPEARAAAETRRATKAY